MAMAQVALVRTEQPTSVIGEQHDLVTVEQIVLVATSPQRTSHPAKVEEAEQSSRVQKYRIRSSQEIPCPQE
jgi:hypothetical protein